MERFYRTQDCGCNNCSGAVSAKGDKGNPGVNGTNGNNGLYGGYSSKWIFDDSTGDHPGLTNIRLSAANPASATLIYINTTNADSIAIASFLTSFDNSASFGWIRIFKEYDSTIFSYYKITAVDTTLYGGTVTKLTVNYVDGSGSGTIPFVDGINMVLSFVPKGQTGFVYGGESTTDLAVDLTSTLTKIAATETATLAAGTYQFTADFTLQAVTDIGSNFFYRYYVGNTPVGTLRSANFLPGESGKVVAVPIVEQITLLDSFKVSLWMKSTITNDVTLLSQSVQFIKVG